MDDDATLSPATLAVTRGRPDTSPGAPVNVSPVLSSTFVADGPVDYGRGGNPTWTAFEEALGALEGGDALVFGSGMGAVSAALSLVPDGSVVVAPDAAYSGTKAWLDQAEAAGRLEVRRVSVGDTAAVLHAMDGAHLVTLESPTNPLLEVCDLVAVLGAARAQGLISVVDNTFATPLGQQPLSLGADVVVHSVTKYLAGHSDVVLGATVTRPDGRGAMLRDRLQVHRRTHGAIAGPQEVFLALRGLRTLAVRFERAQANATEPARRLQGHPAVRRVRHPSLPDHPGHEPGPPADARRVRRDRVGRGARRARGGRAGVRRDAHLGAHDVARRRRVLARAASPARPRTARRARGPAAALGRHRGRRRPVARSRPGSARIRRMTEIVDVKTPDGRVLRVHDGGGDGLPVVAHHGTPDSGGLLPPALRDAQQRGLRLISYDRPGYGGSTRQAGRTVASAAVDVAVLLDDLGLDTFVTWGSSGGGPHALACAALLPGRCLAAASVAGVAPYRAEGLDWLAGMGQDNLDEFGAAASGEATLRPWLETARAGMLSGSTHEPCRDDADAAAAGRRHGARRRDRHLAARHDARRARDRRRRLARRRPRVPRRLGLRAARRRGAHAGRRRRPGPHGAGVARALAGRPAARRRRRAGRRGAPLAAARHRPRAGLAGRARGPLTRRPTPAEPRGSRACGPATAVCGPSRPG
nr:alpha/beta fold hydrolase [Angustibacter aerolatus]